VAILAVECLDLLAAIRKIKTSIGQYAVHIEYDCADVPGFFQYMLHVITAVVSANSPAFEVNRYEKNPVHLAQAFLLQQSGFLLWKLSFVPGSANGWEIVIRPKSFYSRRGPYVQHIALICPMKLEACASGDVEYPRHKTFQEDRLC
jgi:hypothetical protein